ncbi:hypothetical protein [Microvirga lotononidis]|uniref:hypothetical protein n=1 Tax=Microvirga lotononidis TaxID=864069 RepID=UPI0012B5CC10|nr:hypothetical protein [Microvirga lotononidis]WQO31424.1 hypothetical protein U0023_34640 [Microvirga lotononidis]
MAGEPAKGLYWSRWLARSLVECPATARWKSAEVRASASSAPVAISVATSVSAAMAVAASATIAIASPTTTSGIAATGIGRIGALHISTGVVGRLRSVAQTVVVAGPLTVPISRSIAIAPPGTIAIAARTCRPAAATAARASNAAGAAGRATAAGRVAAKRSAR